MEQFRLQVSSALGTMKPTLLLSGKRADFTTVALDLDKKELSIVANYPGPFNASWIEPSSSSGDVDRLIGISEDQPSGLLYTFEIDHAHKTCKITSQQPTLAAPAHCKQEKSLLSPMDLLIFVLTVVTLQDKSALALATVSI